MSIFVKSFVLGRDILLSEDAAMRYYYALENIINDTYDVVCHSHIDIGKTSISF